MIADPAKIMGPKAGAGDNIKLLIGQSGDSQVAFNPAARVQHLGIGQLPDGFYRGRADSVQGLRRPRPGQLEFRK